MYVPNVHLHLFVQCVCMRGVPKSAWWELFVRPFSFRSAMLCSRVSILLITLRIYFDNFSVRLVKSHLRFYM